MDSSSKTQQLKEMGHQSRLNFKCKTCTQYEKNTPFMLNLLALKYKLFGDKGKRRWQPPEDNKTPHQQKEPWEEMLEEKEKKRSRMCGGDGRYTLFTTGWRPLDTARATIRIHEGVSWEPLENQCDIIWPMLKAWQHLGMAFILQCAEWVCDHDHIYYRDQ